MRTRVWCALAVLVAVLLGPAVAAAQEVPVSPAQTTTSADPTTTVDSTTTTTTTTTTAPSPTAEQVQAFFNAMIPANSGSGRRIIYSVTGQRVWLVDDNNNLVRTYLVSGKRSTPKAGVYRVYSKSRYAFSGSARMEYMIRFVKSTGLAIGFHSIPSVNGRPLQTTAQLGTYRSHGCVRQLLSDAAYLWDWAPVGTVVVVLA